MYTGQYSAVGEVMASVIDGGAAAGPGLDAAGAAAGAAGAPAAGAGAPPAGGAGDAAGAAQPNRLRASAVSRASRQGARPLALAAHRRVSIIRTSLARGARRRAGKRSTWPQESEGCIRQLP